MRWLTLSTLLLGPVLACSCTVFFVARKGKVFAAANEDEANTPSLSKHYIRFAPAKKEKKAMGYVAFGYANNPFSDESGMNEAGLFFDFTAQDELKLGHQGKPPAKFTFILDLLTTCRTVKDALKYLDQVDLVTMTSAQLCLGDATGATAIVERHQTTLRGPKLDFLISTNFRPSVVPEEKITCERYRHCQQELSLRKPVNTTSLAALLDATKAANNETMTWYSQVCDLKRRSVTLYRKGDFAHPLEFSLKKELAAGVRRVGMDDFVPAQ